MHSGGPNNGIWDSDGLLIEEDRAGNPLHFYGPGDTLHDHILLNGSIGAELTYSSDAIGIIVEAEVDKPIRLSEIFAQYPDGVDVRWAACRYCVTNYSESFRNKYILK
ncbi:MAG: hypothetical protein R2911_28405 [Caldilineaceae bacterium]